MRTGRPPKPLELRRLHGNPGRRPLPEVEELKPPGPLGAPPSFLSPEARAVWDRVADAMPRGMVASCDLDLMASYVTAVSLHEQTCRELRKTGPVIMGANDLLVVSPWWLGRFAMGPLEWVLRWAMVGRRAPIRLTAAEPAA